MNHERGARVALAQSDPIAGPLELVAELTNRLGRGPTWAELIDAAGWGRKDGPAQVRALVAGGHLEASALSFLDAEGRAVPCPFVAPQSPAEQLRAELTEAEQGEVLELVKAAHAVGARPTWGSVSAAMGWPREAGGRRIAALIRAGLLEREDVAPDPDRPLGPRPVPDFAQVAREALEEGGQRVTPAAVAARAAELERGYPGRLAWQATRRQWAAEALAIAPRAVVLVAQARRQVGKAPTWGELARVFGWLQFQRRSVAVRCLIRSGWLTAGQAPRSLEVGPLGAHLLELRGRRE